MTQPIRTSLVRGGLGSLLLIAGVFASSAAIAQEPGMEEITVRAERPGVEVVGRSTVGAPIELVTLEYRVNYGDLDLASSLGADTFRQRVKDAAKEACDDLNKRYPLSAQDRSCAAKAEEEAMSKVEEAIKLAQSR